MSPTHPRAIAALFLALAASGCGAYHWPDRPVNVPPRVLDVHEEALVSAPGKDVGDSCAASVLDLALSGCNDSCGPVRVQRDGEPVVSLLTPPPKERAPMHDWARPAYDGPARSANREHAAIPLGAGTHTLHVASSCGLSVGPKGSPDGLAVRQVEGGVDLQTSGACTSIALAMVCR